MNSIENQPDADAPSPAPLSGADVRALRDAKARSRKIRRAATTATISDKPYCEEDGSDCQGSQESESSVSSLKVPNGPRLATMPVISLRRRPTTGGPMGSRRFLWPEFKQRFIDSRAQRKVSR